SVKRHAQTPARGEKGAVLINHRHEMRSTAVSGEYYRFSAQGSRLGSSDVKDITEPRDIRKRKFVFRTGKARDQPRAVHKKGNPVFPAYPGNLRQFIHCIKRSVLRRDGNLHHSQKYHMLMAAISAKR